MSDLVISKQRLLRIDKLMLHQRCPFARQRELGIWYWRQLPSKLGTAQCIDDSRRCSRARQVDGFYARMGKRTSDKHRMQHLRQFEIGDELSTAGQQAPVFASRNGTANKRKLVHS